MQFTFNKESKIKKKKTEPKKKKKDEILQNIKIYIFKTI